MKILVFSDSHGVKKPMYALVDSQKPDIVVHLGDYVADARALAGHCPNVRLYSVPGNCDYATASNNAVQTVICGRKKILFSHGHLWRVKSGYDIALTQGKKYKADLVLFGHTHVPFLKKIDGIYLVNPGALKNRNYAVINIEHDTLECFLNHCPDMKEPGK